MAEAEPMNAAAAAEREDRTMMQFKFSKWYFR
jgi:hypothetical protein